MGSEGTNATLTHMPHLSGSAHFKSPSHRGAGTTRHGGMSTLQCVDTVLEVEPQMLKQNKYGQLSNDPCPAKLNCFIPFASSQLKAGFIGSTQIFILLKLKHI